MIEEERESYDLFGFVKKKMLNSFMKIVGVNLTGISSIYI